MESLKKYKKSIIRVEVSCNSPERLVNNLWKQNIDIKEVKRINVCTISFVVPLKFYGELRKEVKKLNGRMKIKERKGIDFFFIKCKSRMGFFIGIVAFFLVIYYLSGLIWKIDIVTEKMLSPFEVRKNLSEIGIKEGIKKKDLDLFSIEDNLIKMNPNILWVRVRYEGTVLKVQVYERQAPPIILKKDELCDVVAKCDGEVVRVYSKSGRVVAQKGQVVKKGDVLIEGVQGKEENTYRVHAEGDVFAKTFYEKTLSFPLKDIKREYTGKEIKNYYIKLKGKNIYLKNSKISYNKCDKIEDKKGIFYVVKYKEVKEEKVDVDLQKKLHEVEENLNNAVLLSLDKFANIIDKKFTYSIEGDKCVCRLLIIAEENIGEEKKN